jgi:uncharacterized DUF497 family protein
MGDFAGIDENFFEQSVIVPAKRGRSIAVGRSVSGAILVIFAMLGVEAVSIVSMRYANRKERRLIDG